MVATSTVAPRRDRIVDAATRLFSERGYHGTSMRDIAEASGIRAASLYAHIEAKEDLLSGIIEDAAERFSARLEEVLEAQAGPVERLRLAIHAHVEVVAADRDAARVFLHEWNALKGEARARALELRDGYELRWDRIVREGIDRGVFRRQDATLARILVLSAANWVYTWYDPAGPLTPAQVADGFADLLLRGLRRGGSGKIRDRATER
ncbi:MAG: TetR family transcriptional regulator [Actinomycetota bacterium]